MAGPDGRAPWEDAPQAAPQPAHYATTSYTPPQTSRGKIPRWAWIVVPFVLLMIIGGATLQVLKGKGEAQREEAAKEAERLAAAQHAEAEKLVMAARSYILDAYANYRLDDRKALDAFNLECKKNRFSTEFYVIGQAHSRRDDGSGYDVEVVARPNPQVVDRKQCTLIFSWKGNKYQLNWQ
ncbi:MAG: hypothetical protein H6839_07055 [Planctomycetes bacterium]|nr:hypothetical protein [Planctomycetota bacterium]